MSPALSTVIHASLVYAWRIKKREASFFVGNRDVDLVAQQMVDRGFKVEFQDTKVAHYPGKKMILRW